MSNSRYLIATKREKNLNFYKEFVKDLSGEWGVINCKEDLNLEYLRKVQPDYIFFPHWSFIIPKEIYEEFKCVIFHMTDLPFGRGGSPLQNLIVRGIKETKISALLCSGEIDAGPVFLKSDLSLYGTADEILYRANLAIRDMILKISIGELSPVPQEGVPTFFKRRTPEEGELLPEMDLSQIYDFIRMLDGEGYPPAFINFGPYILEFNRASFDGSHLKADVSIHKKN